MFTSTTIRFLLAHLMTLSVILAGFALPVNAASSCRECCKVLETPAACCHKAAPADCGMACCQQRPVEPMQAPAKDPQLPQERPASGSVLSTAAAGLTVSSTVRSLSVRSLAVPASGSPSLVTQHICLQV